MEEKRRVLDMLMKQYTENECKYAEPDVYKRQRLHGLTRVEIRGKKAVEQFAVAQPAIDYTPGLDHAPVSYTHLVFSL